MTQDVNLSDIKTLVEDQNKAFHAFKETNDQRLAALEKNKSDPLTNEKLDKINASLNEQQKALDAANKAINRRGLGSDESVDAEKPAVAEYRREFMSYIRTGRDNGLQEKAKTTFGPLASMSTDSDAAGGYIVDPLTVKRISAVVGVISAMRDLAEVVPAVVYEDAVEQHTTAVTETSEQGARAETAAPSFNEIRLEAEEMYAHPKVTQKMLDLRPDVESYIAEKVGNALAEREGLNYITGNGVKKARGLLTYTTIANASYAWGKLGFILSGKSAAFADTNPADKLIDLIHALKKQYRANASWLMNDLTQAEARKLKDGNGVYLWQPGMQLGQPAMLNGYPVATDANMPDLASASLSIAFGDFRSGYKILDPGMMTILRDPFTAKPYIVLYTTKRTGGGVANFEAIKLMKFSA